MQRGKERERGCREEGSVWQSREGPNEASMLVSTKVTLYGSVELT